MSYIATTEFYVRYAETDAQGIVHHGSYIIWLEEARVNFARAKGTNYAYFEQAGFAMVVTEINVRYRTPLRFGDRVKIDCQVLEFKSRSVKFGYEVRNAETGAVCLTGSTSHICVTREGQVTTWPAEWRQFLEG